MLHENFNEGIIQLPDGRTDLEGYGEERFFDPFGQQEKIEAVKSKMARNVGPTVVSKEVEVSVGE